MEDFENAGHLSAEDLAASFDPRLADVWLSIFTSGIDFEEESQAVAWFLRMAYLRGYSDALSEETAGQLFLDLGVEPPMKPVRSMRTTRRKGGRR